MLGVLEYRHSDYGKAAQDFAAAEQVLDSQPSALMAYSICLARLNRNSEAMVHFQQLLPLGRRMQPSATTWRSSSGIPGPAPMPWPHSSQCSTQDRGFRAFCGLAAAVHEANNETRAGHRTFARAIAANPDEPANYVEFAYALLHAWLVFRWHRHRQPRPDQAPNSAALYMARAFSMARTAT